MEFPLSELCDRMTILKLKVERLPQDNAMVEQFAIFSAEVKKQLDQFDDATREKIKAEIAKIYEINGKIWDLEYAIRMGQLDEKRDLEEIGRRAIKIREYNKQRLHHKNNIARLSCNLIMWDRKVDHASE